MATALNDLVIFEMANNHQGDIKHGLRIIEEMGKISNQHGLNAAVKLQYRDLDTFIHPDYKTRKDVKHVPRFMQTRLKPEQFQSLALAIKDHGLTLVITAFDEKSVDMALDHGVDILKIGSCSNMDWPLLQVVAATGKPMILSTGGCKLSDVDKIVTFLEHRSVRNLGLLHCVSVYPTPDSEQQLGFMRRMAQRYPHCTVGYSGHEAPDNLQVGAAVVAMGARILERHVGVPTPETPLNAYSMNPDQVRRWVEIVVTTRALAGPTEGDKRVTPVEQQSLRELARGVFASKAIAKGEPLTRQNIFLAMPCQDGQTSAAEYLETMVASRDYAVNEAIEEKRAYDPIFAMRSVVHDAKGLLREARIATGQEFQVELSHHYGMDSFRRFGATIINFFNREYCKKLIILLPGQQHPSHAHLKKEETFQILHGDLRLVLDGKTVQMQPGDIQLVIRGQFHSFSTEKGCVFEEISTTHVRGDSAYEDAKIQALDPAQRKTLIDSW
jgi:sialic acid synthase SpsE/quercetin dioxygenase-like cupin family protein